MRKASVETRKLEKLLGDLPEAMSVSELDGYLAGIIVCPEQIDRSEWLPAVWRGEAEGAPPFFESLARLEPVIQAVLKRYDRIEAALKGGRTFHAHFDVDPATGDVAWEVWIAGLAGALALRPESWECFLEADAEDASYAVGTLMALIASITPGEDLEQAWKAALKAGDVDDDGAEVTEQEPGSDGSGEDADDEEEQPDDIEQRADALFDEICAMAPDLIPACIQTLYDWGTAIEQDQSGSLPLRRPQVGRNEPCPCGSGKKYKKCCYDRDLAQEPASHAAD